MRPKPPCCARSRGGEFPGRRLAGIGWVLAALASIGLAPRLAQAQDAGGRLDGGFPTRTVDAANPMDAGSTSDAAAVDAAPVDAPSVATPVAAPTSLPPGTVVPPHLIARAHPVYPPTADGRRVDVEMLLTVDTTGTVTQAEVLGHVPEDAIEEFDRVARAASRTLRFEPARRDGVAIPVRVRFHMSIAPPLVSLNTGIDDAGVPEVPEQEVGSGVEGISHVHLDADGGASRTDDASANLGRGHVHARPGAATPPDDAGLTVVGHAPPPSRGAGDSHTVLTPGLRQVPVANASDLLRLAPGILLTNEGGDGHAEHVYLRGFDAHEGQDLEFTVNGVPINEAGNPHGEGLVDTHFILPELVRSIRVLEGPFDPHQGNYAVAGSAEYELGLDARGGVVQYLGGSFNTHRILALWGPEGARPGTFAGADLRTTDGFGTNRASRLGRAMAQWELALGPTTTLRLLGTAYATQYGSAGALRQDDVAAGRVDFFGSNDPTQGGDAMRFTTGAAIEDVRTDRTARMQLFATYRAFRLRENYTGFVEDPPAAYRSGVAQRGDAVDQTDRATTVGARGSVRWRAPWRGQTQSFEAGFYGRFDSVDAAQRRLRFGTIVPYRIDFDLAHSIGNIGLYFDAEFRPAPWFTLRGGVRGDLFVFDVLSRCDLHDTSVGSAVRTLDVLCYERDRTGPRDPTARRSASGLAIEPRGTVLVGPFRDVSFTVSAGTGARSADPVYLADSTFAPFTTLVAGEAGALYRHEFGSTVLGLRAMYYVTHVGRDLIFNQQQGRNTLAPGTIRQGMIAAVRVSNRWLDWVASVTFADARFVREAMDPGTTYFPADQGDRVPYVPTWVARSDLGLHGPLPVRIGGTPLSGRFGTGVTFVSPRSLPFAETSDPLFVLDASASVRWRFVEVGVIAQNLLNLRYQLGVYNYVSNFQANNPTPDLLPARHFTAGPPLGVFGTLAIHFGGEPPSPPPQPEGRS